MAGNDSSALVEIDGLSKTFGEKVALEDVTFRVPAGQIFGLLGPNGAGKTTLFRLLMGILKATSGSLRVDGLDAFEDRVEVKRLVGFLPDEPAFYSYLSGREILELSAGLHGLPVRETMERVRPLIERLDLDEAMGQFADDYSRGMKKKLGLILALLHEPKLLILDEPTNGMDVESTRSFYDLMRERAALGTTVFFSTHLMDQVSRLCTDVAIIRRGRVVATGGIEALRTEFGAASLEDLFVHLTSDESGVRG
jgi:ABC-type multidrug transport system ATPase subunit